MSLVSRSSSDAPIFTVAATPSNSATNYHALGLQNTGTYGTSTTEANVSSLIPNGNGGSGTVGTISKIYVYATTTPTGSGSWTVTLMHNGSATAVSCNITSSANPCSDTTDSFTVSAGDTVSIQTTPTNTPSNTVMTITTDWAPTTIGEYPQFALGGAFPASTSLRYGNFVGNIAGTGTASVGTYNAIVPAVTSLTVKGPEFGVSTAPGSTYSRSATVYYGSTPSGVTSSSVTCSITAAATGCSQAPSTTLSATGSTPTQAYWLAWESNCSNSSCAAVSWIKMSNIAVVTP